MVDNPSDGCVVVMTGAGVIVAFELAEAECSGAEQPTTTADSRAIIQIDHRRERNQGATVMTSAYGLAGSSSGAFRRTTHTL
ncbi:MAG: hypothetical protein DI580_05105 [Cutibacterium acnes]|nr:MAG: hypothetical protein DI580_05105 [Cutibacterium acnes]